MATVTKMIAPAFPMIQQAILPKDRQSLLEIIVLDHSYAKPWSSHPDATHVRPMKTLFISQPEVDENILVVDDLPESSTDPPNASRVSYDIAKAKVVMMECEKHVNFATSQRTPDTWEEQISRNGWTSKQNKLFDKVIKVLSRYRLARLAYDGSPNEPVLRRIATDKATKRVRQILSGIEWEAKLTSWLHDTLVDGLSIPLLACYLDVLQTMRAKVPSLVDKMTSSSLSQRRTTAANAEALTLLLKRPWDPAISIQTQHRQRKLPGSPLLLIVPSGPTTTSSSSTSRRSRFWHNQLSVLGKVVPVTMHTSNGGSGVSVSQCLDHMIGAVRAKVLELRSHFPNRPVILIGWSMGALVSCQVALMESVCAVVCLGFPFTGLEGARGDIEDPLLEATTPTFFIVGTHSTLCSQDDLEELREKMKADTSLLLVGGGDDQLRLTRAKKKHEGVTQSMVDRCIMDEIGDFLGNVLTSMSNIQPRNDSSDIDELDLRKKKKKRPPASQEHIVNRKRPSATPLENETASKKIAADKISLKPLVPSTSQPRISLSVNPTKPSPAKKSKTKSTKNIKNKVAVGKLPLPIATPSSSSVTQLSLPGQMVAGKLSSGATGQKMTGVVTGAKPGQTLVLSGLSTLPSLSGKTSVITTTAGAQTAVASGHGSSRQGFLSNPPSTQLTYTFTTQKGPFSTLTPSSRSTSINSSGKPQIVYQVVSGNGTPTTVTGQTQLTKHLSQVGQLLMQRANSPGNVSVTRQFQTLSGTPVLNTASSTGQLSTTTVPHTFHVVSPGTFTTTSGAQVRLVPAGTRVNTPTTATSPAAISAFAALKRTAQQFVTSPQLVGLSTTTTMSSSSSKQSSPSVVASLLTGTTSSGTSSVSRTQSSSPHNMMVMRTIPVSSTTKATVITIPGTATNTSTRPTLSTSLTNLQSLSLLKSKVAVSAATARSNSPTVSQIATAQTLTKSTVNSLTSSNTLLNQPTGLPVSSKTTQANQGTVQNTVISGSKTGLVHTAVTTSTISSTNSATTGSKPVVQARSGLPTAAVQMVPRTLSTASTSSHPLLTRTVPLRVTGNAANQLVSTPLNVSANSTLQKIILQAQVQQGTGGPATFAIVKNDVPLNRGQVGSSISHNRPSVTQTSALQQVTLRVTTPTGTSTLIPHKFPFSTSQTGQISAQGILVNAKNALAGASSALSSSKSSVTTGSRVVLITQAKPHSSSGVSVIPTTLQLSTAKPTVLSSSGTGQSVSASCTTTLTDLPTSTAAQSSATNASSPQTTTISSTQVTTSTDK